MRIVKAKHEVYGEVDVPESWLRMWPNDYKPVQEEPVGEGSATEGGDVVEVHNDTDN